MTQVAHLIVGPAEHGVIRHAELIARACGHPVIRAESVRDLPDLRPWDVVHVPFTDRLFAPELEAAAAAFGELARQVARAGAELSVTLHDVPHDTSPLQLRRREAYRGVIRQARGVVVNSRLELSLVEGLADTVHSLRLALLPVEDRAPPAAAEAPPIPAPNVTVLGFVYPDRGYEDVIAALPGDCTLIALGRAAAGHEELPARYAAAAARWILTGFLPEEMLSGYLRAADVPVAPNRRVTASGSISSWLAHRRRPLVPDSPYARELARSRPETIAIYDPDSPRGLRAAIAAALEDPGRTWLAPGVVAGPSVAQIADIYRAHLASCAPAAALPVPPAGVIVPGNRWDLLTGAPAGAAPPSVSVVIPYYQAPDQLDRLLAGIALQAYPAARLDVVIVDDGSPTPPSVRDLAGIRTRVLRQEDRGFRAARARNLGARASSGDILVFLDGDMIPEPGFLEAITALPGRCPDVIAVGRRRHADLSGLRPGDISAWLSGQREVPEFPEPAWLREAYGASADLLRADHRSYRYIISAVLAVSRRLFEEIGGFDERFVGYGGEDWDLAHRGYVAGAVLAHVPGAVGWHDGPQWAQRDAARQAGAKNGETAILSALLPDPVARGPGQWLPYPSVVVTVPRLTAEELLAVARTAFSAGADCGLWAAQVDGPHRDLILADPRLHLGSPGADVLARALYLAQLSGPADLAALPELCDLAGRHGWVETPAVRVRSVRSLRRSQRWARDGEQDSLAAVLFGRQDRCGPAALADLDLAAILGRLQVPPSRRS